MKLWTLSSRLMALLFCLMLAPGLAAAQGSGSLSDREIEFSEAKVTLESVAADNEALRAQVENLQKTVSALTESLAVAQSESEVFKRQAGELKLRMEALGLDGVSGDRAKLEQRLLRATSDLRILQSEKDEVTEQLLRATEAVMVFLKSVISADPEARLSLEAEMRRVSRTLGVTPEGTPEAPGVPVTLQDAMVISLKDEFSLVVANVGSQHGVKIGMPFQVLRGSSQIGLVRVVDVREKISGAVIQNLNSARTPVKVGDRLRVDAQ